MLTGGPAPDYAPKCTDINKQQWGQRGRKTEKGLPAMEAVKTEWKKKELPDIVAGGDAGEGLAHGVHIHHDPLFWGNGVVAATHQTLFKRTDLLFTMNQPT
jgi:hypothetical protein